MQEEDKENEARMTVIYDCESDKVCNLFGKCGDRIKIKNNVVTVTGSETNYQTVYGSQILNPQLNSQDINKIQWFIEIGDISNGMYIGIANNDKYRNDNAMGKNDPNDRHYMLYNSGGKYWFDTSNNDTKSISWVSNSQDRFYKGSKMMIEFDLEKKRLSLYKENKMHYVYIGTPFENIECGKNNSKIKYDYRLCILTYGQNSSFTLKKCQSLGVSGTLLVAKNEMEQTVNILNHNIKRMQNFAAFLQNRDSIKFMGNDTTSNANTNTDEKTESKKNTDVQLSSLIACEKIINECAKVSNDISILGNKLNTLCNQTKKDIQTKIKKPNEKEYQKWDIGNIIRWIISLDKGRYKRYHKALTISFEKNQVTGNDIPDISRNDLNDFGVTIFGDRVKLEKHFKKLGENNDEMSDVE